MRRGLAVCIILMLSGATTVARAQSSTKTYRIGWLVSSVPSTGSGQSSAEFRQELREIGYVEGRNLIIVDRYGSGKEERLAEGAAQLVHLPVDVIVTSGEPAARAARLATTTIPIVMTEIAVDPVKEGLVASLGRPGANVTGLTTLSDQLWPKRLALLKEVGPRISRVAVLWNPANPGNAICMEEMKAAAPALGLKLVDFRVGDLSALDRALAVIEKEPPDAIVTCWDSVTMERAKSIADVALRVRVPTLAPIKEYVQAGWLISPRSKPSGGAAEGSALCGQNPQGDNAGQPSGGTAIGHRLGHEPCDGQGTRSYGSRSRADGRG